MANAIAKARKACLLARKLGMRRFAQELGYRAANFYHERRLRVSTDVTVALADLGIDDAEQHDYMAMGYPHIWAALRSLPVAPRECTFVDFGCGLGRAVVAAATLPYRQVIGIDISDRLIGLAQGNVDGMRHRKAGEVRLVVADASRFEIPSGANLMYFYNPFRGRILDRVVDNIRASFELAPRSIYIVFFNNGRFDKIVEHQGWIRKIWQRQFYPHYSCGAYLVSETTR
jgi:SAM-dependent methyltransferase